ncbi:MAG: flagellar hook-length control protein FliK [Gammaproteobacteria bacterium]|nr:flagellar hook-length control protein FliK [Gammaproteobacteria bacterium]
MENSATSSLVTSSQVINPALAFGQGTNLSENQLVISGEEFGDLLRQLLGGVEEPASDVAAMQQLLPQGGEPLPLSTLDSSLLANGMAGGVSQDQSLEMLVQQFKQLGQPVLEGQQPLIEGQQSTSIIVSGTPILPGPAIDTQLSTGVERTLPPAILMKLSAGVIGDGTGTPLIPLEVADTALDLQPTLLPTQILAHLKAKQSEVSDQADVTPIKLESISLQENTGVSDTLRASIVPLMVRTSMSEGIDKGMDSDLAALTGLHSSSNVRDRSANILKSVAETTTSPMKSNWATALDIPLASPQWKSEFGQRILMMTKEGVQTAELRLNPAHLGPIEVRITLNDDQASINFSANHSSTRDAIESSMPRLRELFQSNGLMLADAQVSGQSSRDPQQRRQSEQRSMNGGTLALNDEDINVGIASRSYYPSDQGLALAVDFYA